MLSGEALVPTELLGILVSIATILGVPWALYLFWSNTRDQRAAREMAIYDALGDQWREYLKLAIQSPKVGATLDEPPTPAENLSADEQVVQDLLFEFKTSMFENAFIAYRETSDSQRRRQWVGWDQYISACCLRMNYRDWWASFHNFGNDMQSQYDADFEKYVLEKFARSVELSSVPVVESLQGAIHAPR